MKIDLSKYQGKGYTGLANLGNTCFMNSCMQIMNHIYELNELFMYSKEHVKFIKHPKKRHDIKLIHEWVELQEIMWANNGAISPNKFVHNVQKIAKIKDRDIFTGWAQNDMPEFLRFIVECMHNSISRGIRMNISGTKQNRKDTIALECYQMLQNVYEKEYSEVMKLFYGIYVSDIKSVDTNHSHSIKPEMYFILDLPLPTSTNGRDIELSACFDLFTQDEILQGSNAWLNEKTNEKETVHKQITFWNFPDVLVISLKRFNPCGTEKRTDLVKFPLEGLDLAKYVCGYNPRRYVYDLIAVCNHFGNVMGGHYTSFVKNYDDEWIHFNDVSHEKISDPNHVITPMAYCLFYRIREAT